MFILCIEIPLKTGTPYNLVAVRHSPSLIRTDAFVSTSIVLWRLSGLALRRGVAPSHTTVDNEIRAIDKAALVAGQEEHTLSLLDGLTETSTGEMNLTTVTLCCVVAKPVLEKRCAGTMISIF